MKFLFFVYTTANQGQGLKLKIFPEVVRDVLELEAQEVLEACSSVCGIRCCHLLDLLEGGIDGSCCLCQLGLLLLCSITGLT